MAEERTSAQIRKAKAIRAARISAAQAVVAINKRLRQPTDPDIVELAKQTP